MGMGIDRHNALTNQASIQDVFRNETEKKAPSADSDENTLKRDSSEMDRTIKETWFITVEKLKEVENILNPLHLWI
jgi:hypothetical protein